MINETIGKKEKQTANLQLIKETNLAHILNLIYKCGSISRAELAKMTKLSPTTVSSQVDELIRNELVMEVGAGETGTSGRKPIMISINANGGYFVSIEIVHDGFYCSLYNLVCKQLDVDKYPLDNFSCVSEELAKKVIGILKSNNIPENKLLGIAVGVPALIDYQNNLIISSTIVPLNEGDDLLYQLRDRFKTVPITLENVSFFNAYAEKVYAHESNVQNLVFIEVNVGIGAGIIIDGKMYRGSFGMAGEIGHISIDINGPKCKCGNRGCMEIMASIPAMVQMILFGIMSGRDTVIKDIIGDDLNKVNFDALKYAIDKQDELALEVIEEFAKRLAFGINNVINLFNPQVIVIGGEITEFGDIFLKKIRENLNLIELRPNINKVEVRYSAIDVNASTLGGARYIFDYVFHTPGLLADMK